jgi:hypothetical protein
MMVAERVIKWLRDHRGYGYCDGCIARELNLSRPQQVQAVTSALVTATSRFQRFPGSCYGCGRDKLVTEARSQSN